MCQCVLCDCWWCNFFGVCCAGWHAAYCCASCWLCKPIEMSNPACCTLCNCTGWGHNCFCYGGLWCAPEFVKEYSRFLKGDGGNVIVVNTGTPMTQPQYYWNDPSIFSYLISISTPVLLIPTRSTTNTNIPSHPHSPLHLRIYANFHQHLTRHESDSQVRHKWEEPAK